MKNPGYFCPVCGFRGLKEVPYDEHGAPSYEICPCCGFEFGFEEKGEQARFREDWIRKGAPWSQPDLKPADWDLKEQLNGLSPDPKPGR